MNGDLLAKFLVQECTPYVRRLLEDALANPGAQRSRHEFNCFQVTVDHASGAVLIEDVLDAAESGVQRVSLEEFMDALGRCRDSPLRAASGSRSGDQR